MEIVGGFGVPHTPHFPGMVQTRAPLAEELERLYGELRRRVDALAPDVAVFVSADHYNLFFAESIPIFSIGVADAATGPSDYPHSQIEVAIDGALGRSLQRGLVAAGFDVGMSQEFALDHPFTVSLGFVRPELDVPIVPLWISAFERPIPSAQRCHALGRELRRILEALDDDRRAIVIASGSFSLEIGGPRISETSHTGVPAPGWAARVLELMGAADIDRLVAEATDEQLDAAGSAGGELLLWLTMLGALDPGRPDFLEAQPDWGHAYGAWSAR
jgi:protocatechuate 4,5-dioxygenase beta chain